MLPTLTMARAWKIAERAANVYGGSKAEYFRGIWKEYKEYKENGESLEDYFEEFERYPYPEELPVMEYHEGQGGADYTPEYLPTGSDSGAWYVVNNTFEDSPDGRNRLWLGRGEWLDGTDYKTNQVMKSFCAIANNAEPYKSFLKGREIEWSTSEACFIWKTPDRPSHERGKTELDLKREREKKVKDLTDLFKKGIITADKLLEETKKI